MPSQSVPSPGNPEIQDYGYLGVDQIFLRDRDNNRLLIQVK